MKSIKIGEKRRKMVGKNIKSYLPLSLKQWTQVVLIVVVAAMVGVTGKVTGLFGRLRGKF